MKLMFYGKMNVPTTILLSLLLFSTFFTALPIITANSVNHEVAVNALQKFTSSARELLNSNAESVNVIVSATNSAPVVKEIENLGGVVTQVYKSVKAVAASVPTLKLLDLAATPSVKKIYSDSLRYLASAVPPFTYSAMGETGDKYEPAPLSLELMKDVLDVSILSEQEIMDVAPNCYVNPALTHASDIWSETNAGSESVVAIIDTGCWNESYTDPETGRTYIPWYLGNVIGGIDLSYDVGTPYEGYGNPMNHYHGTACASLLAAHAILTFPTGHPWAEAMVYWYPDSVYFRDETITQILVLGTAPNAQIYAIKIFDHTGAGVPSSIVMAGIDHAIQLKESGVLDVDVISMSLGGAVGAPGEDPEDLLVDAATDAGITVVVAAGNEGPALMEVGSPGTAKTAITVGGARDPIHERVYGSIALSSYGFPIDYGYYWYPHDEMMVVNWASKGPTADGRVKPDVIATASWLFVPLTPAELPYTIALGGGTSFSTPQVSGLVALLNSYIELNELNYGPEHIKEAIKEGADPLVGFSEYEQGAGYVNAANALNILTTLPEELPTEGYVPNHIGSLWCPPLELLDLEEGKATIENIVLEPGRFAYFSFWVTSKVDSIKIYVENVTFTDFNPLFGDSYNVYLSTAERDGSGSYYIEDPEYFMGDSISFVALNAPCEPGVVRLALENDFSSFGAINIGNLTIKVTTVFTTSIGKNVLIFNSGAPVEQAMVEVYPGKIQTYIGSIKEGEDDIYHFTISDETGYAYVFLYWYRDWAHWATSDLDLLIFNPDGTLNWDGATTASPEVASISGPGDYEIWVDGYQVYFDKTEYYELQIIYFTGEPPTWASSTFSINYFRSIRSPASGVAVTWIYDEQFDTWYIGGFTQLRQLHFKIGCGRMGFIK